jgi:hypothetical protein
VNIAALISSFSNGTFTVTRTARGNTTRGRISAGTTSSVTITAVWHPAGDVRGGGGNVLRRNPNGRDTDNTRVLYTSTQLYVGGPGEDYEADKVSISGISWEVESVEAWTDGDSSRVGYRCMIRAV